MSITRKLPQTTTTLVPPGHVLAAPGPGGMEALGRVLVLEPPGHVLAPPGRVLEPPGHVLAAPGPGRMEALGRVLGELLGTPNIPPYHREFNPARIRLDPV